MEFKIDVEQVRRKVPVTIFHIQGTVNIASADTFEARARQSIRAGTRYLLLDFKDVDAIRSAGLRSIQVVYKTLMSIPPGAVTNRLTKSQYLKIANLSPLVHDVFEVTGFLRNIATYNDLETALDSFGSTGVKEE
jgi:anti-anti-sigma factor